MEEKEKSLSPKEQRLADLKHLRYDFLDDLPPEKVTHADPDYHRYKCRGNYFQGVVDTLSQVVEAGDVFDPELQQKVIKFMNYACNEHDFSRFTTRKDLDRIDKVLDDVIDHLS